MWQFQYNSNTIFTAPLLGRHTPGRFPRADPLPDRQPLGHTHPGIPPPPGIRSMSGRYASYWNAFLFVDNLSNLIFHAAMLTSLFLYLCLTCGRGPVSRQYVPQPSGTVVRRTLDAAVPDPAILVAS